MRHIDHLARHKERAPDTQDQARRHDREGRDDQELPGEYLEDGGEFAVEEVEPERQDAKGQGTQSAAPGN